MSSQRHLGGLMAFVFLMGCRLCLAIDMDAASGPVTPGSSNALSGNHGANTFAPGNPASINGQTDLAAPAEPPAVMALPANGGTAPGDASTTRKFYTLTASLREIYDSNDNTSNIHPQASLETELSPSILVDFPSEGNDFTARYTLDLTYYNPEQTDSATVDNGGKTSNEIDVTHEFVAQYAHTFSDRFSINLAEDFRYFIEPSIDQSTGSNYQQGAYVANVLNGTLTAQWTPLIGTTTSYSNTIVRYDEADVADFQDNIENTGTQSVSYAVLPKISASLGGTVDNITYKTSLRGYTTYTGFVGGSWQVLPSLSVTGQGGATYIVPVSGSDSTAPYAALTLNWNLGARSSLSFNYAHEITPSDQVGANGQTSDRFSSNFRYDINTRLSSHLQGTFTYATVSQDLLVAQGSSSYQEDQYYLDTGLTYHYNSYLDLDSGVTISGVASDISNNSYSRDEVYLGVRGTY